MYLHKRGHAFVIKTIEIEINFIILCIHFDSFKKNVQFKHLITLVYKTQNDIYILSKLFLNLFTNLTKHQLIY